ncbi:hypothetical protein DFH11DRAFT_1879365 [Phellopilus nigrolimitatus]|nr:hypothetical protein DFH11DRAFT_1879365 [Phellopilus nigrolimitatus]
MSATSTSALAAPTPPTPEQREAVFEHLYRRLAVHRNDAERWASAEAACAAGSPRAAETAAAFVDAVGAWANALLRNAWVACGEPGEDAECPTIDPLAETSTRGLAPLPPPAVLVPLLNTILLLHLAAAKHYSAHTRALLLALGPLDEAAARAALRDPAPALAAHTRAAQAAQARKGRAWRALGVGGAALAGGVLVGVTGGLAAPLVGAGVSALLGGAGAVGVLAAGLAGSSAVCGALFGAYGAREGGAMLARHTRDVADLALVPVRAPRETLAVRICVTGWLADRADVTAPWTVFDDSEDTFALQWEVDALMKLSTALRDLVKSHALQYLKVSLLKHTALSTLLGALSPAVLLKLGALIDNPWANACALARKAGAILGALIAAGAFGARPVSLAGFSLGALVVLSALEHLAALPPARAAHHRVHDAFLLGAPAPAGGPAWARARRAVAGRLVNAHTEPAADYVLAVLARGALGTAGRGVAGLQPVCAAGVENVFCAGVEGHVAWRGVVGRGLAACGARGVRSAEAEVQERTVGERLRREAEEGLYSPSPGPETGPALSPETPRKEE